MVYTRSNPLEPESSVESCICSDVKVEEASSSTKPVVHLHSAAPSAVAPLPAIQMLPRIDRVDLKMELELQGSPRTSEGTSVSSVSSVGASDPGLGSPTSDKRVEEAVKGDIGLERRGVPVYLPTIMSPSTSLPFVVAAESPGRSDLGEAVSSLQSEQRDHLEERQTSPNPVDVNIQLPTPVYTARPLASTATSASASGSFSGSFDYPDSDSGALYPGSLEDVTQDLSALNIQIEGSDSVPSLSSTPSPSPSPSTSHIPAQPTTDTSKSYLPTQDHEVTYDLLSEPGSNISELPGNTLDFQGNTDFNELVAQKHVVTPWTPPPTTSPDPPRIASVDAFPPVAPLDPFWQHFSPQSNHPTPTKPEDDTAPGPAPPPVPPRPSWLRAPSSAESDYYTTRTSATLSEDECDEIAYSTERNTRMNLEITRPYPAFSVDGSGQSSLDYMVPPVASRSVSREPPGAWGELWSSGYQQSSTSDSLSRSGRSVTPIPPPGRVGILESVTVEQVNSNEPGLHRNTSGFHGHPTTILHTPQASTIHIHVTSPSCISPASAQAVGQPSPSIPGSAQPTPSMTDIPIVGSEDEAAGPSQETRGRTRRRARRRRVSAAGAEPEQIGDGAEGETEESLYAYDPVRNTARKVRMRRNISVASTDTTSSSYHIPYPPFPTFASVQTPFVSPHQPLPPDTSSQNPAEGHNVPTDGPQSFGMDGGANVSAPHSVYGTHTGRLSTIHLSESTRPSPRDSNAWHLQTPRGLATPSASINHWRSSLPAAPSNSGYPTAEWQLQQQQHSPMPPFVNPPAQNPAVPHTLPFVPPPSSPPRPSTMHSGTQFLSPNPPANGGVGTGMGGPSPLSQTAEFNPRNLPPVPTLPTSGGFNWGAWGGTPGTQWGPPPPGPALAPHHMGHSPGNSLPPWSGTIQPQFLSPYGTASQVMQTPGSGQGWMGLGTPGTAPPVYSRGGWGQSNSSQAAATPSAYGHGIRGTYQAHHRYWFADATVSFLVENVEYRVHRYLFENNSTTMRQKLAGCPLFNAVPVELRIGKDNFECLLAVLYHSDPNTSPHTSKVDDWLSVYLASVALGMPDYTKLAIEKVSSLTTPADRLALSARHGVREWAYTAYEELCLALDKTPSEDEAHALGMKVVLRVWQVQQEMMKKGYTSVSCPKDFLERMISRKFELDRPGAPRYV